MIASAESPRTAAALSEEDAVRASFYALLARLFCAPPDAALLEALAGAGDLGDASGELGAAWKALADAARNTDAGAARDAYDRLFIGVGRPEIMLYGSYYQAGFMMEKPLALLRDDLAELGLARVAGVNEPEDHFAALAEVMRTLVSDPALEEGDRASAQERFFDRHIAPWYGKLAGALERSPEAGFYAVAGRFARAFLDIERMSFEIQP
ncbi:MAG TPA: molecular chaperone [Rhodocyclaceae bacterium]|nr:MAG: molecular chaperone [Betaproteobacteria bacterium CG2_30_68_42]PIV76454.1 MAG: molecular chaperone [Rhodocyclales bacterium CG17_big_fil_post_rev_8_21_14_2_50_68_7]PJA56921.1 MAG: molecular chaperone [Rhodocyclales bacterium CG_4_9_14_3_um_filter_68_10]HCX33171.1 molecular chaperone [Rhodocyclaceae bacterium]